MNKSQELEKNGIDESKLNLKDSIRKNRELTKNENSDYDENYDDDDEDDDDDEEDFFNSQVKALFSEKVFANIKDMFKYESEVNNFNIIDVVKRYKMDMISYIKMVNYIRQENPKPDVFNFDYKNETEIPWNDEKYLKTSIEDDAALQFDVEEDLDVLELSSNKANLDNSENDLVKVYKNKLKESESKVDELVDIVEKLRNVASNLMTKTTEQYLEQDDISKSNHDSNEDDSVYVNSYSNYSIHLEMLQDKVRTEGYMNAILDNRNLFKDKIVLDVGCGSGILSLFAAKAGAKLVIAVDMSNIINHAVLIAKENGFEKNITFLRGKIEEVKLPVDKVDIIISEWMGYFLLFESMLDSVIYARDKYLDQSNGLILPNFFDMSLFGVGDEDYYNKTVNFWSDVYGFKMSSLKRSTVRDAQVTTIDEEAIITEPFKFKEIDCLKCTVAEISKFETEFNLKVNKDTMLTGIGSSFDTYFNDPRLDNKSFFSTSPFHTTTHWQQTVFQLDEPIAVKKDSFIEGKITCYKNPDYLRSYVVVLRLFDKVYKYKVE